MTRAWRPAALLVLALVPCVAADEPLAGAEQGPFLSLLQPGQTVLVARFQFGFELVIAGDDETGHADAHLVTEVGKDYVVLVQGEWEKRIASSAIAVIGRKKSPLETAARGDRRAAAAVLADRRKIQGKWRIVSARVSGREVALPDDVVWTFAGDSFLSGGYFPAAVEGQRDPGREQFELAAQGAATELAHVAFSVPRGSDPTEEREPRPRFHAVDKEPNAAGDDEADSSEEARELNVLRISVTLKEGGRRKLEGVYSLSGDTLTVCLGAERPATRLRTGDDDGLMLFVLERVPAA